MNQNYLECYAVKPTSPEKGLTLVKHGNSSMNDIYTKLIFYIPQEDFVSVEFHFCRSKFLLKFIFEIRSYA